MNKKYRIDGLVSVIPRNNDYNKLVIDIKNNLKEQYNPYTISNENVEETILYDEQYSIGDLICDICHLMYSVNYNNEPHHYTNMNTYLRICIQFVNDIIQKICIFETSFNEKANITIAEKNFKTECFNILSIYDEKFKQVNFNDSNINYFNTKLYEMIIKIFNYKYNFSDFDSTETTFTTYSNARLTWEIIHKKLLIIQNEKKEEYNTNRNKKLMIQNSYTISGFIENLFYQNNTNIFQITNEEDLIDNFSNSLITD